jgi:hypothetical protein
MQPTLITDLLKDLKKCRKEEPAKFLSYEKVYHWLKTKEWKKYINSDRLLSIFSYQFEHEYYNDVIQCPMEAEKSRQKFNKDIQEMPGGNGGRYTVDRYDQSVQSLEEFADTYKPYEKDMGEFHRFNFLEEHTFNIIKEDEDEEDKGYEIRFGDIRYGNKEEDYGWFNDEKTFELLNRRRGYILKDIQREEHNGIVEYNRLEALMKKIKGRWGL